MTADGNWNLVVSTPMGERRATLSATTDGSTLKGSQDCRRKFRRNFRRHGQWQ